MKIQVHVPDANAILTYEIDARVEVGDTVHVEPLPWAHVTHHVGTVVSTTYEGPLKKAWVPESDRLTRR